MSIFAIADLHLSFGCDKPMNVFGPEWEKHYEKIERNWQSVVSQEDTVVIIGDISWGMSDAEALPDLEFINRLNGKKILMRGNHDYWWSTKAKLERLFASNGLRTISALNNGAVAVEGLVLCGGKGYYPDAGGSREQDKKLLAREYQRLKLSLEAAKKIDSGCAPVVFLHYPPVLKDASFLDYLDLMAQYGVQRCFYGHLHAQGTRMALRGYLRGIDLALVSADFVDFTPQKIC